MDEAELIRPPASCMASAPLFGLVKPQGAWWTWPRDAEDEDAGQADHDPPVGLGLLGVEDEPDRRRRPSSSGSDDVQTADALVTSICTRSPTGPRTVSTRCWWRRSARGRTAAGPTPSLRWAASSPLAYSLGLHPRNSRPTPWAAPSQTACTIWEHAPGRGGRRFGRGLWRCPLRGGQSCRCLGGRGFFCRRALSSPGYAGALGGARRALGDPCRTYVRPWC